jgi:hypothetical protein
MVPKRCFTITLLGGQKLTICIVRQTWPLFVFSAYPKVPTPDPWPRPSVEIEGVKPEVLQDLEILDIIEFLSKHLSAGSAKAVSEAVHAGVKQIQHQLPSNVSIEG